MLRAMGCDLMQGFLYGIPLSAEASAQALGRPVVLDELATV